MEKATLSRENLQSIPFDTLVEMYLALSDNLVVLNNQIALLQAHNEEQTALIKRLEESVAVLTQKRFGKSSEKGIIKGQLCFDAEGNIVDPSIIFNEAESVVKDGLPEEPEYEEVVVKRKKRSGKRSEDIGRLERVVEPTVELSDEVLAEYFPEGYTRLPDEVHTDVEHVPERFIAHEHHYAVYGSKKDGTVIRASSSLKPERLLANSLLTPSLFAAVFEGRYVQNLPLNRIHDDFARKDLNVSRQVLAGWVIKVTDRFLRPLFRHMENKQRSAALLHCDESPFVLSHGENKDGSSVKAYMWVYHSNASGTSPPIFIYIYQPGRKADYPAEYLKDYHGVLMTDGYQVYHTLEKRNPGQFVVAGCWVHARRPFAEQIKANGKHSGGTIADEAVSRIAAIYHVDNMCKDASPEKRREHRNANVRPLVDSYFEWLRSLEGLDQGSKTYTAVQYSLNQEPFLRQFLENPIIPLDNNDAERSIRTFCQGKHACNAIDSAAGAEASAIMYSIAETAKANGLKPYEYMKYLLEQMLIHLDDAPQTYIEDLAPWSDKLPDICRKLNMDQ